MVRNITFKSKLAYALLLIILILGTVTCLIPLWYILCVSVSNQVAVAAGKVSLWPVGINFTSYKQIVADSDFFNSFWISIKRVVLGLSITFVTTVLMAYPLSKNNRDFKHRNKFMWLLIFGMMFRPALIPTYVAVKSYGLYNNIWALVLGGSLPIFNVILVMNFFRNLPKEMQEAAYVDGAGPWQILLKIMVPVSKPVLATISLFIIVGHWNEFFLGMIFMKSQESYPLQTYIRQMVVQIKTANLTESDLELLSVMSNRTLNAAKIFISMIPILLIYPFLQKYFVKGITLGSVKE